MKNWIYYNHAMIPTTAPNEPVDTSCIEDKSIWKENKRAILARWTSDFDCGYETEWWYVIKDAPTVFEALPKQTRKEVRRGLEKLDIRVIDPIIYAEQIKKVYRCAVLGYVCPEVSLELTNIVKRENEEWIGCFLKGTDELIAWKRAILYEDWVSMATSKAIPEYRNLNPFAVMNYWQIDKYINSGKYAFISNGSRNILHKTNYNDYLIAKFGFRKAYCQLHLKYNPKAKWIIALVYPMRRILIGFNRLKKVRQLNAVLKLEEIVRRQKKEAC